ncbi:MAG: serine protease [Alphaproteobacteria bacterium]
MRGSLLTVLVIAALVAVGLLGQMGGFGRETPRHEPGRPEPETPRRPRPDAAPRPDGARPLPPPSTGDPAVDIAVPAEARSSTGTAFSLDGRGVWMTARHVADGCSRIFVLTGPRVGHLVRGVYIHRTADVAILRTDRGAPHIAFSREEPRISQTAYHYGYPKGEPGAVISTLIGRATMRARGRYNTNEPVLVWAEKERVPEGDEHLGGISGGPVFDTTGHVIGTTVAGSTRRGRVFTSDMSSIRSALQRASVTPAEESSATMPRPNARNWVEIGSQLRGRLTVAKVVCLVDQQQGWRPRGTAAPGL